jgi:hypothetical protein
MVDALIKKRTAVKSALTRFETRLNKFNLETDDASELELRYNNLSKGEICRRQQRRRVFPNCLAPGTNQPLWPSAHNRVFPGYLHPVHKYLVHS